MTAPAVPRATAPAIPRATARLQLHHKFTLDDAAAVVPYLAALGISHVYTSPLLTARPGSMHGYDIVDHAAINPELGGEPALRRLVTTIRAHEMGLIVDIVPNHMGVGGADNAWWLDVLEWGRASPYARFFDIDWDPPDPLLRDRVLSPFLGAPYGQCLQAGDIQLCFDPATGGLSAIYHEHVYPITPRDYPRVFPNLPPHPPSADPRIAAAAMKSALAKQAETPAGAAAIATALTRFDQATEAGQRHLHDLLERQHYRMVWWRAAADEINWRRFFDVNALAGLRAELPPVFEATHQLILRLYAEGLIDGLRIDHVDGLADPRAYCRKLRRRMETAAEQRPADAPPGPAYIVVEKILAAHERLPPEWMTDGTTGYDFMNQVALLLHDPKGEVPLTDLWTEMSGNPNSYETEERLARRVVLRDALASELNATAAAMHRVARRDLTTRDYTLTAIRRALTEILVHFPVYRLYAGLAGRPRTDDQVLAWAVAGARRAMRSGEQELLDIIGGWLGAEPPSSVPPGPRRRERLRAIVRFEQLSSPVAAKSMEDTAFYRYGRLLSRNEVGANPAQFARPITAFHAACADRAKFHPHAMLATATHDHKRGEDLRVRLAVLSEIPDEWNALVHRWSRLNTPLRKEVDGTQAPDGADEMMLYQMLAGAWPLDLRGVDADGIHRFASRITAWQQKALRESKRHSSWSSPNDPYETACRDFVFQTLDPTRASHLTEEIAGFANHRIGPLGAINGLTQTLLRLTVPGVPDLYQGCDLWDLSMVDPDNRSPVDYDRRRAMLTQAATSSLLGTWRDGAIKQSLIAHAMGLRRDLPDLFAEGKYIPLWVDGPKADHVVAFARQHGGQRLLAAAVRLPAALLSQPDELSMKTARWDRTRIMLPRGWNGHTMRDALGGPDTQTTRSVTASSLFSSLPVALRVVG